MSAGREAILKRRAGLVEQVASERDQLSDALRIWQRPLRMVDEGVHFVQTVRRAPPVFVAAGLAAAGVAAAIAHPRRFTRWFHGGLTVWRLTRVLRGLVDS